MFGLNPKYLNNAAREYMELLRKQYYNTNKCATKLLNSAGLASHSRSSPLNTCWHYSAQEQQSKSSWWKGWQQKAEGEKQSVSVWHTTPAGTEQELLHIQSDWEPFLTFYPTSKDESGDRTMNIRQVLSSCWTHWDKRCVPFSAVLFCRKNTLSCDLSMSERYS